MVIIPRRMISNCAHARQKSNRFTKMRSNMSFACNSQCQICKILIFSLLCFQFYSENFHFSVILLIFPKFRQKTVKSHHFLNEKVMIFWQKFLNLLEFRNWKIFDAWKYFWDWNWQRSRFPKSWRKNMTKMMMSTKH